MNFFKKIDRYLLLNHPVLWRTKAHYFVIFSLILGNMAAFGLGYFPVKWYGAIEMGLGFFLFQNLTFFILLIWLITQARNKIRYYNYWDEVLTFSVYIFCTMSLIGNSLLFDKTLTHTTANLVSVEQIDIDKELVRDKREIRRNGHDFSKYNPRTFPPEHVVDEMMKRYQIDPSYIGATIPAKVSEITQKVNNIYHRQLDLNMRPSPGTTCGVGESSLKHLPFIFLALLMPVLLFLISHTNLRVVLVITGVYVCVVMFGGVFAGALLRGGIHLILYVILCAFTLFGNEKVHRNAALLIIPYTMMLTFWGTIFPFDSFIGSPYQLILSLLITTVVTAFSSAFFIKKYFEPAT